MSRLLAVALGVLAVGVPGSQGADSGAAPASVVASPLVVRLSLTPSRIGPGQTSRVTATVTNVGPDRIREVTLTLRSEPTGLSVTGPNPRRLSTLAPKASATGEWTLCGRGPAGYVLVAQARGRLPSGTLATADSDARVLTITGPPACR